MEIWKIHSEEFENIKGVIRTRKSKTDRQHNGVDIMCPLQYTKYFIRLAISLRVLSIYIFYLGVVSFVRLPCLTNESVDFEDSRKALTNLVSYLETTFNNIKQKIKTLNKDLQILQDDFKKVTWKKYNGHCYHYGTNRVPWFAAKKKCREIGGYLVKVDNVAENNWIASQKPKNSNEFWIGLTDLQEGKWRWSYDQSHATFKTWYPGYGSKGTSMNCVSYWGNIPKWHDQYCHHPYYFICESNFCSK